MVLRLTLILAVATSAALASTITGLTITPSTISFSSSDPDLSANGSSSSTVRWTMGGNPFGGWSMTIRATSPTLTGCPSVPVSAIRVQCTSVSPQLVGNGSCGGAINLSTTGQTVASGTWQGLGIGATVATFSFVFTDAWRYPASSSCSIQLNYTITSD